MVYVPTYVCQYATEYDITVLQLSDQTMNFQIFDGPLPYVFTLDTLVFVLKATDMVLDNTGYTNTPASTSAQQLLGQMVVTIPAAQIATSGTLFYHIDTQIPSGTTHLTDTLVFGTVSVLPI